MKKIAGSKAFPRILRKKQIIIYSSDYYFPSPKMDKAVVKKQDNLLNKVRKIRWQEVRLRT